MKASLLTLILAGSVLEDSRVSGFNAVSAPTSRPFQNRRTTREETQSPSLFSRGRQGLFSEAPSSSGKGFGTTTTSSSNTAEQLENTDVLSKLSSDQVKELLVDLLPRMTGQDDEFRTVEAYVNALESGYQPAQTLDFLNLAMQGEWQLLFSTNLAGTPNPGKFRLRELIQRVDCNKLQGSVTNEAVWDLAQDGDGVFDATGTFSVVCSYEINQGARMLLSLEDHVLKPARGSKIPTDVPALVGLLHRAMPKELFDPTEHAADTTYLDGNLKIVRYTGPRLEGVRDIFIRRGALQVDPSAAEPDSTGEN